jgi:hypothetical protein
MPFVSTQPTSWTRRKQAKILSIINFVATLVQASWQADARAA